MKNAGARVFLMSFRPLPILTTFTVVSLAILILLGNWQWSRFHEKRYQSLAPEWVAETLTVTPMALEGYEAQQVYGLMEGLSVWRRYVPGRVLGDDTPVLLLWDVVVDIEPAALPLSQLAGIEPIERESVRFVPHVEVSRFAGRDRPESNIWYQRDARKLLANLGLDGKEVIEPVDVRLQHPQLGPRIVANPYAASKPIDPLPPARHLGYALTWWGLAGGLIGVYLAFHAAQGRLVRRRD